jgi:subtilisin family serine protease
VRSLVIAIALCTLTLAGPGTAAASGATDPLRQVQWALDAIHLGDLDQPIQRSAPGVGRGVVVAIIDSGVERSHPDLRGRVIQGPDFVDGPSGPDDPSGHGTHLAGLVAAASGNGIGGAGVAPAARILAIRVLDDNNLGSPTNVAAGINAATDARADVINLSLNWSVPNAALAPVTAAMRRAADAGITIIVASGNDDQPRCEEPILPNRALCVGAVNRTLRRAPFSSHGSGLGIVAPGDNMLSTWRDGAYTSVSGTSQSAAVTSGVAALLAGVGLHGKAAIDRLAQTARDIGVPGPDELSGHGLLDAERALEGAPQGAVPPLLRISASRRADGRVVSRRGLIVNCDAARPGTCRVRVRAAGVVIAKGEQPVDGSGIVRILARSTRAGRELLHTPGSRRATIEVALDGAPGARRPLTLGARAAR